MSYLLSYLVDYFCHYHILCGYHISRIALILDGIIHTTNTTCFIQVRLQIRSCWSGNIPYYQGYLFAFLQYTASLNETYLNSYGGCH